MLRHQHEDESWEMGRRAEAVVRAWLVRHGERVVPCSLIETGAAPALLSWVKDTVLPDILTFGVGGARWIEVKLKSRCPTYAKGGRRLQHGIDLPHWRAYLEVERETQTAAWLAIVEAGTRLLLLAAMQDLAARAQLYEGPNWGDGHGGVFFPRDAFALFELGSLAEAVPPPRAPQTPPRPWEGPSAPRERQERFW